MSELSIYVADLAAYNAGVLRGAWLDVDGFDKQDLNASIHDLMSKWDCEEWAFHDYEGFPDIFGEYPSLDDVISYIQAVDEHGKCAIKAYLQLFDLRDLGEFSDRFLGDYESDSDFVWEYLQNTGLLDSMPETLQRYFDAEAFLRDEVLSGAVRYIRYGSRTFVFSGY